MRGGNIYYRLLLARQLNYAINFGDGLVSVWSPGHQQGGIASHQGDRQPLEQLLGGLVQATAAPILFTCSKATLWNPPGVSIAMGRKALPWSGAASCTLRLNAFFNAAPDSLAAASTLDCARGPDTITSSAPKNLRYVYLSGSCFVFLHVPF